MTSEHYEIDWNGIKLGITYEPMLWNVTSHLEVRSLTPERAQLPITETGYRSHFMPIGTIEAEYASAAEFVRAWLDHEAQSKEWLDHVAVSAQGDLFG